ncbi:addiction module protein [Ilumatobacter sp.]|uniref:addiction module protein n=1 Tax=Ilumatobacter sp. TaxID=1967498 RepID=UPI003C781A5C
MSEIQTTAVATDPPQSLTPPIYDGSVDHAESHSTDDGPEPSVEQIWATEIERRSSRVLTGESLGIPWPDAKRRIEQELLAKR